MAWQHLILNKENNVGILSINSPETLNAISSQILDELNEAIDAVNKDDDIHVLIITGEGRSFVAGADISEMHDLDAAGARTFSEKGNQLFRKIELMEKPVIAAVNGFALGGGCELAMSCDIRIASEKSKFKIFTSVIYKPSPFSFSFKPEISPSEIKARFVTLSSAVY